MSPLLAAVAAGAVAGLASSLHCGVMCGPVAVHACRGANRSGPLAYQLGRSLGYAGAGAAVGAAGALLGELGPGPWGGAALSWLLGLGLAMSAHRLWRRREESAPLVQLGTRPSGRAASLRSFGIGTATTFLPCGALAGALLLAAGSGAPWLGAATMLAFATVTGFALVGAGFFARYALRRTTTRRALAVALALGAIVLLIRPLDALRGEPTVCHGAATAER